MLLAHISHIALSIFRGVVRWGQKRLKAAFQILGKRCENEKLYSETPSKLIIMCVKSREFFRIT